MSIRTSRYASEYSLADFITNRIKVVEASDRIKIIEDILNQNHALQDLVYETGMRYFVRYKKFKEIYPPMVTYPYMNEYPVYQLDDSLRHLVDQMDAKYLAFQYDMDKLKNFISYVERYAISFEYLSKYIPIYFLEMYPGRLIETKNDNPEELSKTIETKFKEEIPLLKRYFLMVRLHNME